MNKIYNTVARDLEKLFPLVPGKVQAMVFKHEQNCPRLRGGRCRCNPSKEILTKEKYLAELRAGQKTGR